METYRADLASASTSTEDMDIMEYALDVDDLSLSDQGRDKGLRV